MKLVLLGVNCTLTLPRSCEGGSMTQRIGRHPAYELVLQPHQARPAVLKVSMGSRTRPWHGMAVGVGGG